MTPKSSTRAKKPSTGRRKPATRPSSTRTKRTTRSASSRKQKDIIALLKEDHREVEQMFRRFSRLGPRAEKSKRSIVRDVVKELSKHAAVEEQILYPSLAESAPRGKKMMDEGIKEHQTVKELLADLDRMAPDDDGFDGKMSKLMEEVRHHVREEESEMLPSLRQAVPRDRLVEMGKMLELAKKTAPTRPHPHAPSKPPANVVVGVVAGVADRVRDLGRAVLGGN